MAILIRISLQGHPIPSLMKPKYWLNLRGLRHWEALPISGGKFNITFYFCYIFKITD
jgi:hypothetical protein